MQTLTTWRLRRCAWRPHWAPRKTRTWYATARPSFRSRCQKLCRRSAPLTHKHAVNAHLFICPFFVRLHLVSSLTLPLSVCASVTVSVKTVSVLPFRKRRCRSRHIGEWRGSPCGLAGEFLAHPSGRNSKTHSYGNGKIELDPIWTDQRQRNAGNQPLLGSLATWTPIYQLLQTQTTTGKVQWQVVERHVHNH